MTGYLVRINQGDARVHAYRPGETEPFLMVKTVDEAWDMIEVDKAQGEPDECE